MTVLGRCHALCLGPYSGPRIITQGRRQPCSVTALSSLRRSTSAEGCAARAPAGRPVWCRGWGRGSVRSGAVVLLVERCGGGASWCCCGGESVMAFRLDLGGCLLRGIEWLEQ